MKALLHIFGTSEYGKAVGLNREKRRHLLCLGKSGSGKSVFLFLCITQDILAGVGSSIVIDPHGSLIDELEEWLSKQSPKVQERVVIWRPARDLTVTGFNPIAQTDSISYTLNMLVEACLKVTKQVPGDCPRLSRWLRNLAYPILKTPGMTLAEIPYLLNNGIEAERLIAKVDDGFMERDWKNYFSLNVQRQDEMMDGPLNRLSAILSDQKLRRIYSGSSGLDFSTVFGEGKTVFIDLSDGGQVASGSMDLLGTLIVNNIVQKSKLRPYRDPSLRPVFLYCDEFARYITSQTGGVILDELRKYRITAIFAGQHMEQLRRDDSYLCSSVLTNCDKVIFGGLSYEDVTLLAWELGLGLFDSEAIKNEIFQTKSKVNLEKRIVQSWGNSTSKGSNWMDSTSSNSSQMTSRHRNVIGQLMGANDGSGFGSGSSHGSGGSMTNSQNYGRSETIVNNPISYRELSSRTYRSIQEQHYIFAAMLKNLRTAEAVVKLGSALPVRTRITRVPDSRWTTHRERQIDKFREGMISRNPSLFLPPKEIERQIEMRRLDLIGQGIIDVSRRVAGTKEAPFGW